MRICGGGSRSLVFGAGDGIIDGCFHDSSPGWPPTLKRDMPLCLPLLLWFMRGTFHRLSLSFLLLFAAAEEGASDFFLYLRVCTGCSSCAGVFKIPNQT